MEPLHEIPNVRVRSEAPAKQPMLLVSDLGKGLSFVGKHQGREYGVRAAGRLLRSQPGSIMSLTNDQDSASVWPRPALARWSGLYRIQDRRAHGADCASSPRNGPRARLGLHAASGANSVGNASDGTKRFRKPVSSRGRACVTSMGLPHGSPLATASPSVSPSLSERFFCQLSLLGHP